MVVRDGNHNALLGMCSTELIKAECLYILTCKIASLNACLICKTTFNSYNLKYIFLSLPFILLYQLHVAVWESRHDLFLIPGDSVAPSVCALGHGGYWAGLDGSVWLFTTLHLKSSCHHTFATSTCLGLSISILEGVRTVTCFSLFCLCSTLEINK